MNYGKILTKIINDAEKAKVKSVNASIEKQNRALLKERIKFERLIADLECDIMYDIKIGNIPQINVKDYTLQTLVKDALAGISRYQDLWTRFTENLKVYGLVLKITYEHDGMGIESWLVISVNPLD